MKTNKTKPIKKIMIFTIITVMIVSLFAVPTFAIDGGPTNAELVPQPTQTLENPTGNSYFDGWYCIQITRSNLASFVWNSQFTIISAPYDGGFVYIGGEIFAFTRFDYVSSTYFKIIRPNGMGEVPIYTDSEVEWSIYFILENYPFDVNATNGGSLNFWTDTPYNSYVLISEQITPDPDDPDDPIPPAEGEEQGIFAVWSQITQWIVQGLASVSNAFYANGELTLLGTLCIIPLAIGVAFLLIAIIQKFLRLRG